MHVNEILAKIKAVTGYGPRRSGTGYQCRCPSHEDRQASLSVSAGDDGRVLLHCHAGCDAESVVAALGLRMADLMPPQSGNGYAPRAATKPPRTWATIDIAAKACCPPGHTLTTTYMYSEAMRPEYAAVVRYDSASGKTIRPFMHLTAGGWAIGDPSRWTPYHADQATKYPRHTVVVCEGEKCADAATAIGLLAVTSAHGASAAANTDWAVLAGRNVVILPDADAPGERYATDVALTLHGLGCRLKIVRLPGLQDHGDIVDWLAAMPPEERANAAATIEALADAAPLWVTPETGTDTDDDDGDDAPDPLTPREPFPVAALPPVMRDYSADYARVMGCPVEYAALPMLAVAAGAIGMARTLRLRETWCVPSLLWLAIVGPSAAGKSPPMRAVLEPLRRRQRAAFRNHSDAMESHAAAMAEYDMLLAQWKKSKGIGDPPVAPVPPACVRYTVDDATMEALCAVLAENPKGVLLTKDELGGWLESMDAYRDAGDVQRWLSIYDADDLTVDRRRGVPPVLHVSRAGVSIIGGVQPGILQRLMTRERLESGLMGRLLIASPDPVPARWTDADVSPSVRDAWAATVDALCDLSMDTDADGEPVPVAMDLQPDARAAWIAWHDAIAAEALRADGATQAALGKLREYAARLAMVLALARDPAATTVDGDAMAAGITLARFFAAEARRWYGGMDSTPEAAALTDLIRLIRERFGGRVTPRQLKRSSRKYQPTEKAESALQELVSAGRGKWEVTLPESGPGKPLQTFVLDDRCHVASSQYSQKSAENANNGNGNTGNTTENAVPIPLPEPPDDDGPPPDVAARLNEEGAL